MASHFSAFTIGLLMSVLGSVAYAQPPATWSGEIERGTFRIEFNGAQFVQYDLIGSDFHFVGEGFDFWNVPVWTQCGSGVDCGPLTTVSLSAIIAGTDIGQGTAIVPGLTVSPAFFSGSFEFQAESIAIPRGNRRRVVLSSPLTLLSGGLSIYADPASRQLGPGAVAAGQVVGSGTVTLIMERVRLGRTVSYVPTVLIYTFGDPAHPGQGGNQRARSNPE